ncbi:MAG: CDP-diacylglycerol--glycerol-3-phosphate 3-phosphatidyltransferase [Spirochaetaceae bacterium]|jgi:CDP-diacylglycerol--glycerol-3-phosphate 3-phosphatidyltransferase|nr:CDP-diacylglycerol--glycerol-3-phosphate 3-phosphatidyltransferase [Spirochaetaceae bacterium]
MLLSNKLSLVRVFFAPIFFIAYSAAERFSEYKMLILICLTALLVFVEFTDFLDGYIARKFNQVSDTGKLLDPFSDAFLHINMFFCFTVTRTMPAFIFALIFYREFLMLFLRMLSIKKGAAVAARMGGKLKTVLYIITGFCALIMEIADGAGFIAAALRLKTVLTILFYLCAVASYISFADYLIQFRKLTRG